MEQIAIIHFTNYPKGQSRPCMAAVMRYTMQEKKTLWEDQRLVSSVNCRPESAYDDFLRTKLLYHKNGGVMFFHMVQSFPKGEDVDPVTAHAAALKLAEYFEGREVLVCTHTDRDHIHSHFIINSVSLEDGKKLHISEPELTELRQRNDQVCMEFGLPVFQPSQKKRVKSMSNAEYHTAAKGESWKFRLINTIDECMRYASTKDEFISLMESEGYGVRWTDSRKNITYTTPGGMKCRDDRLHDEKYLKGAMEREFRIRAEIISGGIEATQHAASNTAAGSGTGSVAGNASDSGGVGRATEYPRRTVSSDSGAERSHGTNGVPADHLCDEGASGGASERTGRDSDAGRTGWEEERAAYLSALYQREGYPAWTSGANSAGDSLGRSLVQLGRTLERGQGDTPLTSHPRSDRKVRKKEQQKKIALGHKENDHEERQGPSLSM